MAQTPEAILHLEKCLIRPYCQSDAEDVSREADNPRIAKWMTNRFPHPYLIDDAKKWIATSMTQPELNAFAICRKDDNRVIGGIGLEAEGDVQYRTMTMGYWLGESHWRCGIATEVVTALSRWAFEKFPHVIRLQATVFEGNEASAGVLQKAGYHFESRSRSAVEKNSVVMDLITYCMLRR
ncbi:hypothetical protein EYZ11_013415 [Aspergillus tanneri]|uniref:N-acetyltransferase domain-containing protein n=1 Tax=Aspergillus tanneri TaxID=1220188 RepID=A0A4S3IZX2_9EURO|nr:uncharacterized protein ATNIH1004_003002 [Aspergillus tanneri]KAA8650318.1 hypothetical protein ATNIH1004_003002 [Aspergillus tanneri]THC87138.1 hypothetical protein EYZ11_013415 [Aspergillus tanneri]